MEKILIVIISIFFLCCCSKPAIPKQGTSSAPRQVLSQTNPKTTPYPKINTTSRIKQHDVARRVLSPAEIFERYSPAVFKIHTSNGLQGSQGSGFFISADGIAVSNYHVFQDTYVGYEEIILSDGNRYKVSNVYHKDSYNDFIIFRVRVPQNVNYIKVADAIPAIGEKVYTIGSPRGLDNTFSSGEISQKRNNGKILQISAPIDHGSSGGVLLNAYGEAIGITFAGYDDSGANLNFAININIIKPHIQHLID